MPCGEDVLDFLALVGVVDAKFLTALVIDTHLACGLRVVDLGGKITSCTVGWQRTLPSGPLISET